MLVSNKEIISGLQKFVLAIKWDEMQSVLGTFARFIYRINGVGYF